ncbi:MAG: hypothetical protein U5L08_04440 [Xanthomonadales bacterium]|nr:hypothetical protein [Xanthomonadales bacterium]
MTISSNVRTAGPYTGNDTATAFSFTFKVFSTAEVVVIQTDADGLETTLVEGAAYSVALNADQDTAPGGSVTLAAALPAGEKLTVTSDVDYQQPLDLTNQGGFYPQTINDALDRLTILAQQTAEESGRAVKVKISSGDDPDQLVADLFAAEVDAENAAGAAGASASAASTSEGNAANSETAASDSETAAAGSASAASTSASNASASETNAANSASAASTSESNAAASASAASTSEGNASNSETAAGNSAQNAADSETAALAYLEELRGRWFGALSSDPTTDPNGDALEAGDAYWHIGDSQLRVYNGTAWEGAFSAADAVSHSSQGDGLADTPTVQAAIERLAFVARHYDSGGLHEATGQTTIQTPEEVQLRIGSTAYVLTAQTSLGINTSANWDDGTNATPANRAGKDFYLYYCQPASGSEPDLILSANSTMPSAIPSGATPTADNTRKIAGFHCLCADVGTITGHSLSGFVAGDILPRSVWDQFHRPESEPEGMVYADCGKWADIYLASVSSGELVSASGATIADGASAETFHWYKFDQWLRRIKKRFPFQGEFVDLSIGSNQGTNTSGSADPGSTGGHSDTAGRRMISAIGCEDCAGALWQWGIEGGATNDVGSAYSSAFDANDSDVAGEHYEAPNRPLFGGGWADGSYCGSRGSNWASSPLSLYSSISARGVAEPAKNRRK